MPVGIRRPLSAGRGVVVRVGGCLALGSAPALAAAPEAPVTGEANPVTTTTATLNGEVGELNPENALEVGTYEFLYRESATTCEGGKTAPVPAGVALSKEPVSQSLSGLLPGTTYTFCLLARNAAEETALGAPVTFTTLGAAGSPKSRSRASKRALRRCRPRSTREAAKRRTASNTTRRPTPRARAHGTSITKEGEGTEGQRRVGHDPGTRRSAPEEPAAGHGLLLPCRGEQRSRHVRRPRQNVHDATRPGLRTIGELPQRTAAAPNSPSG